jgi:hypothetical protein
VREFTVMVIVDVPVVVVAAMGLGLKVTVTPEGTPEAARETAESKPFSAVSVIVSEPDLPGAMLILPTDGLRVKVAAGGEVTVSVRVVVCVILGLVLVPVTVIVYVPAAAPDEPTAKVRVEEPAPVMDVGLKLAVTPVGRPDADRAIAESNPFTTVEVTVDWAVLFAAPEIEVEVAESEKFGAVDAPTKAVIRPAPFMLPQPVARS